MSNASNSKALRSLRRYSVAGLTTVLVLIGGGGGWAYVTELAGAVIAQGQLVVESDVKKVQHQVGGIVGELRVHDGDLVRAGDALIRLDATQAQANLAVIADALDELAARQAREEAERDGESDISFPESLLTRVREPRVARLMAGEKKLFEIRNESRSGQKEQLKQRIVQLQQQIAGLSTQAVAKSRETALIEQELEGVRGLWEKKLVQMNRIMSMERDRARVGGEEGVLVASIAEVKDKITETELQILQIDADMRAEVGKDLADIRAKTAELEQKRVAAEDQLKRIDIRAPQDGKVHQLTVHTVGGVIQAGETIMLIVPNSDALNVEAKVAPQEIDQLYSGQPAILRFSAFNQRTTPEINGEVSRISADVTQDLKTGAFYYMVRIKLFDSEIARLGNVTLVPGMPVETFVQTSSRTVLSYLAQPLFDQAKRAFTEQ